MIIKKELYHIAFKTKDKKIILNGEYNYKEFYSKSNICCNYIIKVKEIIDNSEMFYIKMEIIKIIKDSDRVKNYSKYFYGILCSKDNGSWELSQI